MTTRFSSLSIRLAACVLLAGLSACAGTGTEAPIPAAGVPMATGTQSMPPAGFIGFCVKHLKECSGTSAAPVIVELSDTRRHQLDTVQARVNHAVAPREIADHSAWDYPTDGYGDCNRYALEKRRELIALGWPREALLLAAAMTETNEGHLVLVARTSAGDLVLDNRQASVVEWSSLPYRWISRQSERSPVEWVSILGRSFAIAAAGNPTATQLALVP